MLIAPVHVKKAQRVRVHSARIRRHSRGGGCVVRAVEVHEDPAGRTYTERGDRSSGCERPCHMEGLEWRPVGWKSTVRTTA